MLGLTMLPPVSLPMEKPTILREALAIHRDEHGLTDEELASIANVNVGTLAGLLPEHFRLPEEPRLRIVSGR